MCPAPCPLRPLRLVALLGGMVLIGGHLGTSNPAPAFSAERPASETIQQEAPSQDSSTSAPTQNHTPPPSETESAEESAFESLVEIFILGPILAIVLGLLLAFPATFLGVSLVMDGGCLRFILFGMGWLCAIFYGLLTGAIVGEEILGLEFLEKPITYVFLLGYPVAAYWGRRKLQSMPQEQYRAWDQTLTGGALLGFGAGSIAGLLRSAASGFGGFGGGSFGGGGASGSWSGASGAASTTSSAAAGGASSTAAGTSAPAAGGSTPAAAVATGAAPGAAAEASSSAPARPSENRGLWARFRRWLQKFQWYHGLVFVLVSLVFVPLGLGAVEALQNKVFFGVVLASMVVYSFSKLVPRDTSDSVISTISSLRGGEASSSWS